MKKFLKVLLCLTLAFSAVAFTLTGCGSDKDNSSNKTQNSGDEDWTDNY
jgi:hypothetical protein